MSQLDRPGVNQSFALGLLTGGVVLFAASLVPVFRTRHEPEPPTSMEAGPADTMVAVVACYVGLGLGINLVGDLIAGKPVW